ncbi:MAG: cupin domain-containing protein [Mycobacteriales bacterium]
MAGGAYVQLPNEGRLLGMGPFQMLVRADGAQTGGGFALLEADEPPNFGPPMHIHDDTAEAFYVLEGEYRVFIADDERVCPAGSFVFIPPGVEHGFRVGRVQSRKLVIFQPAAMVGYFEELASANAAGTPLAPEQLSTMAARHSMRVIGPVPGGYL